VGNLSTGRLSGAVSQSRDYPDPEVNRGVLAILFAAVILCTAGLARADDPGMPPADEPAASSLNVNVVQQAQPDECFKSIGSSQNVFPAAASSCAPGTTPKVNQAYLWGLSGSSTTLWYGTAANVLCEVIAGLFSAAQVTAPPFETSAYVCEFSDSNFLVDNPSVPPELGDWRPPKIYSLDLATRGITDRTPNDSRIDQTLGIRSAIVAKNVAILGGPVLAPLGPPPPGINLFAFNATTGAYLGSTTLSQYSDIRIWINYKGATYTGVQNRDGTGSVLKWTGNLKHPFDFQVVGSLDNEASYIIGHNGRVFATTWRNAISQTAPLSGLWMSPKVPLNPKKAGQWQKIWNVGQYEADPLTASVWLGGALGEEGPFLYWGLMQVPGTSALVHFQANPPSNPSNTSGLATTIINSSRAIPIFRCCNSKVKSQNGMGSPVELLYGDSLQPVFSATNGWQLMPNKMDVEPTFGPAGFGNPFNTYAWSMASFQGQLYVGTFDWSFILADLLTSTLNGVPGITPEEAQATIQQVAQTFNPGLITFGADLWVFANPSSPAVVESQFGVGNFLNYGIRTMFPTANALFLGTANPMNLRTDTNNPPVGGFELLELTP
jgi:hypothetical protein